MVSALVCWLCFGGSRKKEVTLKFQKYVTRYVDAKIKTTGLVKVKIDLCHDYPP